LNPIIGICKERIEHHRAFLKEYEEIKGSALELLKLNNNTKVKVVSLIDALKRIKYKLYALMERKEGMKIKNIFAQSAIRELISREK